MDSLSTAQIKLKEEILSTNDIGIKEILEAVNILKQKTDSMQMEMNKESDNILSHAERLTNQRTNSLRSQGQLSYNSDDSESQAETINQYEMRTQHFQNELESIQEEHKLNSETWAKFQQDMVEQEASAQLIGKVKNQLESAKKVNTNMTKMLA